MDNETKKAQLEELLRSHIAIVTFTKKDGTTRVMQCTLDPAIVVPYERKTNDKARVVRDDLLPVWDVEANGWRTITVPNVLTVEIMIK